MENSRPGRQAESDLVAAECDGSLDLQANVGLVIAHAPESDPGRLRSFAAQAAEDAVDELASATDVSWRFHLEASVLLSDHDRRRPSAFLDRATQQMFH